MPTWAPFRLQFYFNGHAWLERQLHKKAIAHNTIDLRHGKALEKFSEIITRLSGMLERLMEVLRSVDLTCIADGTLNELPRPSQVGSTRVGGIDLNKPCMRAVIQAATACSLRTLAALIVLREKVIKPVPAGTD